MTNHFTWLIPWQTSWCHDEHLLMDRAHLGSKNGLRFVQNQEGASHGVFHMIWHDVEQVPLTGRHGGLLAWQLQCLTVGDVFNFIRDINMLHHLRQVVHMWAAPFANQPLLFTHGSTALWTFAGMKFAHWLRVQLALAPDLQVPKHCNTMPQHDCYVIPCACQNNAKAS